MAGEIDTIELLEGRNIRDIIEGLKAQALEKAIKAGADPSPLFRSPWSDSMLILFSPVGTTKIVEVVNLPVQVSLCPDSR